MHFSTASAFVFYLSMFGIDGFWQNGWDQNHKFVCPRGKVVSRIRSEHHNFYEDRRWMWDCRKKNKVDVSDSCSWSAYANAWDGLLDFKCPHNHVLVGTNSDHDNHYEDRRFKYKCCQLQEACTVRDCHTTNNINDLDAVMDFRITSGNELVGLWSEHSNWHHDRVWKAQLCSIKCGSAQYEFININWDFNGIQKGIQPSVVATKRINNPSDADVETTIEFSETRSRTSTTTWEHSFGVETKFKFGAGIHFAGISASASISYDYTQGKETSETVEQSFTDRYTVAVPPRKSVVAKLVVKKTNDLRIPFVVTLRKILNGKSTKVKERGVWEGVLYYDTTIVVEPVDE